MATEYDVYKALSRYIKAQYPNVLFHYDMAGYALSKAAAGKNKEIQKRRGFPDFQILEPRGGFHGLFLEIKKEGVRIFDKNKQPADEHIKEQKLWLDNLQLRGYDAKFVLGFDMAKTMVDDYLSLKS